MEASRSEWEDWKDNAILPSSFILTFEIMTHYRVNKFKIKCVK